MFRFIKLSFCLAFFGFSASLFAQNPARVAGDLLISFEKNARPERIADELSSDESGRETGFFLEKDLRGPMNVWLAHFDETNFSAQRMLELARRHPSVRAAQFNHHLTERSAEKFDLAEFLKTLAPDTIPNDPNFGQQWQYVNAGASGGTVDADIDAELAWDIARGGLTTDGDTIVVCVVDGGFNYNHPDFQDNAWKNWAEIPNNNIDDDQNGWIDDYHGWNTTSNSDAITSNAGHGTPVCGIVGAKGNNGVGVAGVNWNVKIQFVTYGNLTDAGVIEAYSYPFSFRKRWNETAGAEGAFVVATNSSWGIDLGQPSDSPLWCAFYDSLGHEGIVSCGATANANYNIDTQGDLPTACPSDFLISVTNCARTGKKVGSAGYGATTIDLGSFGEAAYTCTTNAYGGFGGTSGATPHVTGAVALLYSSPCSRLVQMAKTNPAEAALLAKKYLMETTDPEATLDGKTVTGGRMNINAALQKMMAECSACFEPFGVSAQQIGVDSAVLFFAKSADAGVLTHLRFKKKGAADWTDVPNVTNSFVFSGLDRCAEYEFQLKNDCSDTTSGWSASRFFTTDGCCVAPNGLAISQISDTTAQVDWQNLTAATGFVLQLSKKGANDWENLTTASNSLIINELEPCTEYEIRAQTVCDTGSTLFGGSVFFKTKGCGACTDFTYCEAAGNDPSGEWIGQVTIGGQDFFFSAASAGYEKDDSGIVPVVAVDDSTFIALAPAFPSGNGPFNEYFRAWIDMNGDGQFSNPAERIFDSGTAQNGLVSGKFFVPAASAKAGVTRLRVSMKYLQSANSQKPAPCTDFNFGQVRDFCVQLTTTIAANEPTEIGQISVLPNPTDGIFSVKMALEKASETRLELFSAAGQLIDNQQVMPSESLFSQRVFDLGQRGAGVYFLKISTENGSVVRRIVRF